MKNFIIRESNCNTGTSGYIDVTPLMTEEKAQKKLREKLTYFMNLKTDEQLEITYGANFLRVGTRLFYIAKITEEQDEM